MKKMVFGRKLSRGRKARKALFRSLTQALILRGTMVTTKAKAKAVQGDIDKIISLAKKNSLSATRKASAILGNNRELTLRLAGIAKAFVARTSGFTKIILLPRRKGDNAEMARIEWSQKIDLEPKKEAKKEEIKETKTKKKIVKIKTTKKTVKKAKE
jgi:large subunit ribosomal protein L17